MVRRIVSVDADERMPPVESKKHLTETEIKVLKQWIAEGAVHQNYWAFEPVQRHAIPLLKCDSSLRNGIDPCVARRLEDAGITVSSEADRATLIRWLYLDLLGIQPSIAAVDAFRRMPSSAWLSASLRVRITVNVGDAIGSGSSHGQWAIIGRKFDFLGWVHGRAELGERRGVNGRFHGSQMLVLLVRTKPKCNVHPATCAG
ncbi:MAG: hypothetical protein ACI9R3_003318 [Verrucomicrobiales bacterium]